MSYQPYMNEDLTTKPVSLSPEWLKTPESHPDHHVVGRFWMDFWHGWVYYCDSYDRRQGYWMWPVMRDPTRKRHEDTNVHRTNVSERCPGGTWHEVHDFNNPKLLMELREQLEVIKQDPAFINRHTVQGEQAWQLAKQKA